ncbi:Fic family protein [Rhodovulum sp. ES.010]|uniref:Fic family protein n=1 Tax=Rhodovulum sp. ES.010 TaxID=1882821 RepID=UPI0009274611|nr:Fic family protein [Rhodovulum sp. ES.010]SIO41125.1 Fic family protein [Rhodovulum sp. ES.010]
MYDAGHEVENNDMNLSLNNSSQRAGEYRAQPGNYKAFFPAPLPPDPGIAFTPETWRLLSDADRALGRLDAVTQTLPDTELFLLMYVRKEALLSSQIEGTQASLEDIIQFENDIQEAENPDDVEEVVNYIRALNHGLGAIERLPVSVRLIREVHCELMRGVRGQNRNPGEIRTIQNWIGREGTDLYDALFVPPPPGDPLNAALSDLERFIHSEPELPVLIQIALVHAQFETIHPFLDGNGRLGRLLITFLLCEKDILEEPSLYISHFFKRYKSEYYERLQGVRDRGDWEGWVNFFLRGVRDVAREGARTAGAILRLREDHRALIAGKLSRAQAGSAAHLLDHMFKVPVISINSASNVIQRSFANANTLVARLCELGLLEEITGRERDRLFRYSPYVALFRD